MLARGLLGAVSDACSVARVLANPVCTSLHQSDGVHNSQPTCADDGVGAREQDIARAGEVHARHAINAVALATVRSS